MSSTPALTIASRAMHRRRVLRLWRAELDLQLPSRVPVPLGYGTTYLDHCLRDLRAALALSGT